MTNQTHHQQSNLTLSYLTINENIPDIKFSLIIDEQLSCTLYVYRKKVRTLRFTNQKNLENVLLEISQTATCNGNNDSKFINLISGRGGVIKDRQGVFTSLLIINILIFCTNMNIRER